MTQLRPDHAEHDPLLISAYVAGDLEATDRARAADLVASCRDCAELAADLRAIAAALPAAHVPPRPRDFRLSATDGSRTRVSGRWSFDSIRRALRPAGAGLATLGIVGLLVAGVTGLGGQSNSIPSAVGNAAGAPAAAPGAAYGGSQSGVASAPPAGGPLAASAAASAASRPAASNAPGSGAPAPDVVATPQASNATDLGTAGSLDETAGPIPPSAPPSGPAPIVVASLALLVTGIVLLLASRVVRARADPSA